jgi:hypothetical protein
VTGFLLTVPEKRVSAWLAETDPRYARAWLDSLPLADPVEAAREIYQSLYTLNRQELEPQPRFDLMELYVPAVSTVSGSLQNHFLHLPFPLPPRKWQLAEFVRQIHMEMAYGYKCCLNNLARIRLPWNRRHITPVASERAMRYLGEVLANSYQAYMPYPPGVWREIHTLYRYAEERGFESEPLNGAREPAAGTTIRQRYLQSLLLGLTGPYQLGQGESTQIAQFLSHWTDKAVLQSDLNVASPVGHFLVDLGADSPPTPYPREVNLAANEGLRVLNTIELVRQVHHFISRVQKGEPARTLGLGIDCLDAACLDLLRRLVRAWALVPRRQHSRLKRRGAVFLCAGLGAVHFFTNGQKPFHLPSGIAAGTASDAPRSVQPDADAPTAGDGEEADQIYIALDEPGTVADSTAGALSGTALMTSPSESWRVDRWRVRDLSPKGLLLVRSGEAMTHVRVGDPLGLQRMGDVRHWSIGVVRWMKSMDATTHEMGVELLAPRGKPVALWPANGHGVREPQMLALLLPAVETMHRPTTLLVARGVYQPDLIFYLYDGEGPAHRVRLLKQMERTGAYEQVMFAPVAEE